MYFLPRLFIFPVMKVSLPYHISSFRRQHFFMAFHVDSMRPILYLYKNKKCWMEKINKPIRKLEGIYGVQIARENFSFPLCYLYVDGIVQNPKTMKKRYEKWILYFSNYNDLQYFIYLFYQWKRMRFWHDKHYLISFLSLVPQYRFAYNLPLVPGQFDTSLQIYKSLQTNAIYSSSSSSNISDITTEDSIKLMTSSYRLFATKSVSGSKERHIIYILQTVSKFKDLKIYLPYKRAYILMNDISSCNSLEDLRDEHVYESENPVATLPLHKEMPLLVYTELYEDQREVVSLSELLGKLPEEKCCVILWRIFHFFINLYKLCHMSYNEICIKDIGILRKEQPIIYGWEKCKILSTFRHMQEEEPNLVKKLASLAFAVVFHYKMNWTSEKTHTIEKIVKMFTESSRKRYYHLSVHGQQFFTSLLDENMTISQLLNSPWLNRHLYR